MELNKAYNKSTCGWVGLFVSSESYDLNFDWSAFSWDRSDPAACSNISIKKGADCSAPIINYKLLITI